MRRSSAEPVVPRHLTWPDEIAAPAVPAYVRMACAARCVHVRFAKFIHKQQLATFSHAPCLRKPHRVHPKAFSRLCSARQKGQRQRPCSLPCNTRSLGARYGPGVDRLSAGGKSPPGPLHGRRDAPRPPLCQQLPCGGGGGRGAGPDCRLSRVPQLRGRHRGLVCVLHVGVSVCLVGAREAILAGIINCGRLESRALFRILWWWR